MRCCNPGRMKSKMMAVGRRLRGIFALLGLQSIDYTPLVARIKSPSPTAYGANRHGETICRK